MNDSTSALCRRIYRLAVPLVLAVFVLMSPAVLAQQPKQYESKSDPKANRHRGLLILEQVRDILELKYFDRSFRGIDIKQRFKAAEDQIKTQDKNWQIYRTIAQVLIDLNDSHTRFLPPDRLYRVEYGYASMMIGNGSFVVNVKPGSDAEKQGLKTGDQILSINGITPTRDTDWVISYLIYGLDPQENLKLSVRTPDNQNKEINIQSKFLSPRERKEERRKRRADEQSKPFKCQPLGPDGGVACKLRTFEIEKITIDALMKEIGPRQKLIVDLRGNGGGLVSTLTYFLSRFFENEVVIGTEVVRDSSKTRTASGSGSKAYKGELIVLIDSESASASEVFARVIQLQKRGKVLGDTSAGAVMTSIGYGITTPFFGRTVVHQQPFQVSFMSVSVGDLLMSDGKRLELVGVAPDVPVGPSPMALLNKTDPVLAYASELLGSPITPEKAGEFYFLIPKSEDATDKDESDDKEN